jgi:uncharacterized LabA/DUF88 family protein
MAGCPLIVGLYTMDRVIAYIDGFNLYFGLRDLGQKRFYWLNLQVLAQQFLRTDQTLTATKYFTAIVKQPDDKRLRQKVFLEALQTLSDFQIFYGHFLSDTISCRSCGHTYTTHHEKMTDVNISVEMMKDAFQDHFDVAFLISADSDLVGPIKTVQQLFPRKKIITIFPPKRFSTALTRASTATLHIGRSELAKSMFPEQVGKNGILLHRPALWR